MKFKIIAALLATFLSSVANAVVVDNSGTGQVLLVPLYSTVGGNDTLIAVSREVDIPSTNQPPAGTAVKAQFRDLDGVLKQTVNFYLDEADSWAAALTRREGRTVLLGPEASCFLIEDDEGTVLAASEVEIPASESLGGLNDGAGFIQFIEMGETTDPELAELFGDCEALAARWNEGVWAEDPAAGLIPSKGRIRSQTTLINVERGTSYSYGPRALDEFSDIVQHTRPSDPKPDLASAHDAGTDAGATTSRLCDNQRCVEDQWADPLDAVRVALLVNRVAGEFSVSEALGARTEGVVTFPALVQTENFCPGGGSMDVVLFSRRTGAIEVTPNSGVTPQSVIGACRVRTATPFRIPMLRIADSEAPILGLQSAFVVGITGLRDGWIQLNANQDVTAPYETATHLYENAVPVVPVLFQEFVNGTLIDGSGNAFRANYGFSIPLNIESNLDIIYKERM